MSSPDLPSGRPALPRDPESCWVVIEADIGPPGSEAADIFTFYVSTPDHLDQEKPDRRVLVVDRFDWDEIESRIAGFCASAQGETWEQIATALCQYSYWEFEGYDR